MKIIKSILFWLVSFTWGLPISLVGALVALALLITGHKPHRFYCLVYFEVGKNWGGFNVGPFFVVDHTSTYSTRQHESGHGIQNLMFGPLMAFIVSIPSAVRYWYREWLVRSGRKTYSELPSYYAVWFEAQASALGYKYF